MTRTPLYFKHFCYRLQARISFVDGVLRLEMIAEMLGNKSVTCQIFDRGHSCTYGNTIGVGVSSDFRAIEGYFSKNITAQN